MTENAVSPPSPRLAHEDQLRSRDRRRVLEARRGGRRGRLLWLLIGPGVLVMLGENDGPSMLSYTATGAAYGIGFFLPFLAVTFIAAVVVQEMTVRLAAVTHRGYGELVFQRYGSFWGWVSTGDLMATNLITLITEFIAIRVGMGYFGIRPEIAVGMGLLLIVGSTLGGRYWRWERATLALSIFNLLFLVAAFASHPDYAEVGRSFLTWRPLPGGTLSQFLLLAASNIGATVTPWMVFFQQSAAVDKGITPKDIGDSRIDLVVGAILAAAAGCGAVIAASTLHTHGIQLPPGSADYAGPLRSLGGSVVPALLSFGLIEAGALACLTISTATAYAVGEATGGAHSFNRNFSEAPLFYGLIIGVAAVAALVVLIPGAPLLRIALNANLLATILMPATLTFVMMLANDREIMGNRVNRRSFNIAAGLVMVLVVAAGVSYTVVSFLGTVTGRQL